MSELLQFAIGIAAGVIVVIGYLRVTDKRVSAAQRVFWRMRDEMRDEHSRQLERIKERTLKQSEHYRRLCAEQRRQEHEYTPAGIAWKRRIDAEQRRERLRSRTPEDELRWLASQPSWPHPHDDLYKRHHMTAPAIRRELTADAWPASHGGPWMRLRPFDPDCPYMLMGAIA